MKQIQLEEYLTVFAPSRTDAAVIYHEIFHMQAYNKHGICIKDYDTVIDVGANIGLFSIHLAQGRKGLQLYLFEPVKDIYLHLQENCKQHLKDNNFHLQNLGLSDRNAQVEFDYSPALSMVSGMYNKNMADSYDKKASLVDWIKAMLEDAQRAKVLNNTLSGFLIKSLSVPLVKVLMAALLLLPLSLLFLWLAVTKNKTKCLLTTLSAFLKTQNISHADLVKIDVEGAELDVLKGIEASDWQKIRQLIIEVHDVKNRVNEMTILLESKGFKVIVDQEDWSLHKLMNIYTIYAAQKRFK